MRSSPRFPVRLAGCLLAALTCVAAGAAPGAPEGHGVRGEEAARAGTAYRLALPGYRCEFPRDHFDHPDYQTEWWYYTGNVRTADGHRLGFELTFFRHGVNREPPRGPEASPWSIRDLYLAHFAISDIDGQAFLYDERANRAGPGLAGIDPQTGRIWNGNWRVQWDGGRQTVEALTERAHLRLTLVPAKAPVIHGVNGVSQKAAGPGHASHYISLTRLATAGAIVLDAKQYTVEGSAWMDHEFFTNQLGRDQLGWDWVGLQLDDGTEVMAGRIRRNDGTTDPFSTATFVATDGTSRHLTSSDFTLTPLGETWTSPRTHATYPVAWRLRVPALGLDVEIHTPLRAQELASDSGLAPSYWEGAVTVAGSRGGQAARGVGYLEMTGYK